MTPTPRASSGRLSPSQAVPDTAAALGQDLTPRFELGPSLGSGGFGVVHRARDRASGREVALKLLHREKGPTGVDRFLREATVAAGLDHPGIVKVHAVGTYAARPCIVYELVEGRSLAEAARTLDLRQRVELVRDVARAVGHAHACGVVHRDLKPDNVLVDAAGRVRVADFGLAAVEGAARLTRTGAAVGTPTHMAPEMFEGRGQEAPGPAVDVWALGVVLYELLTGRLPFDGANLIALAAAVAAARPTPPRKIDPGVPPALEAVCLLALARDPARRPADGAALADALDAALEGRAPAGTRRGWRVPALLAVAGFVAVGCLVAARGARGTDPAAGALIPPLGPSAPPSASPSAPSSPPASPPASPSGIARADDAPAPAYVARRLATSGPTERWGVWLDDARALTGGLGDDLRLWDVVTGDELQRWPLRARCAARLPAGGALLADDEGALHRLAADGGELVRALEPERRIALLDDSGGHVVAVGKGRVTVLDADGARRATSVTCKDALSAAVSPDGSLLVVSTGDANRDALGARVSSPVFVFDLTTRPPRLVHELLLPGRAKSIVFTRDGGHALAGGTSDQILRLEPREGLVRGELVAAEQREVGARMAHLGQVTALAPSPDGRHLFSCAFLRGQSRAELRAWDVASGVEVMAPIVLAGRPETLEVAPSGGALLLGTQGDGVHVWPIPPEVLREVAPPPVVVTSAPLAEGTGTRFGVALDEQRVLTGGGGDLVRLWDVTTGREERMITLQAYQGAKLPGGGALLAGVHTLWRFVAGQEHESPLQLPGGLGPAGSLTGAADGRRALLLGDEGRLARLVDPVRGKELARPDPGRGRWDAAALSPDGGQLLLSYEDAAASPESELGALHLYRLTDPTQPALVGRISVPGIARQVTFGPDGRWAYAAVNTQQLLALDLTQVPPAAHLFAEEKVLAHEGRICAVAVTSDGRSLLSAARVADGRLEVKVWDTSTRQETRPPLVLPGRPWSLDVSPGGRFVVVGTERHGVHVRPLAP